MIGQAICDLALMAIEVMEGDEDLLGRNPIFNNEVTKGMSNVL